MKENRIYLDIPEGISIVTDPVPGEVCFRSCRGQIDFDAKNILVFPPHVRRVVGSFFTGFFKELRRSMTPGDINRLFAFDQDMPCKESAEKAFMTYLSRDM